MKEIIYSTKGKNKTQIIQEFSLIENPRGGDLDDEKEIYKEPKIYICKIDEVTMKKILKNKNRIEIKKKELKKDDR